LKIELDCSKTSKFSTITDMGNWRYFVGQAKLTNRKTLKKISHVWSLHRNVLVKSYLIWHNDHTAIQ